MMKKSKKENDREFFGQLEMFKKIPSASTYLLAVLRNFLDERVLTQFHDHRAMLWFFDQTSGNDVGNVRL